MPAKTLALALILLSSAARADSTSPLFGSDGAGGFQITEITASVDKIAERPQPKIIENMACSAETCSNPRNFAKANSGTSISPQ